MDTLIEKLKQIEQLCLPNGAIGAVWLDDVIEVIEKHIEMKLDNLIKSDKK